MFSGSTPIFIFCGSPFVLLKVFFNKKKVLTASSGSLHMIVDNNNWVMTHGNLKKRKGGKRDLGRDFKDLKITTATVKREIFFSAWGTRKALINA